MSRLRNAIWRWRLNRAEYVLMRCGGDGDESAERAYRELTRGRVHTWDETCWCREERGEG